MKRYTSLAAVAIACLPFIAHAAPIATAKVKIEGGPNAGQHEASTDRVGCTSVSRTTAPRRR
jgi:hypothetical protein